MPSIVSKRQQQRNEKALQDLIRSVPGNDRCADCGAFNPGMLLETVYSCRPIADKPLPHRMGQLECTYTARLHTILPPLYDN
jgi:hypothetical protein